MRLYLQAFLNQHLSSYTMIQRCPENVQHQFPDTRQIVKWILNNVDCEDSDIRAEITSIRTDDAPDGLRNYLKAALALLLLIDPVPNKRNKNKIK